MLFSSRVTSMFCHVQLLSLIRRMRTPDLVFEGLRATFVLAAAVIRGLGNKASEHNVATPGTTGKLRTVLDTQVGGNNGTFKQLLGVSHCTRRWRR